ncbi:MAG: hypothetical protein OXG24_03505 [Gammaproteobacteria bacterium]|nr:hypothetical protein [Gammaproteobacteria bacterium]
MYYKPVFPLVAIFALIDELREQQFVRTGLFLSEKAIDVIGVPDGTVKDYLTAIWRLNSILICE